MNTLADLHWDSFRRRLVGGFYTTPEFVAMRARNAQHECPRPIKFESQMMQEAD